MLWHGCCMHQGPDCYSGWQWLIFSLQKSILKRGQPNNLNLWLHWIVHMNICNPHQCSIVLFWSNKRSRDQRSSAVAKIFLIQAQKCLEWKFYGNSISQSLIRAAECFGLCRCLLVSTWSGKKKEDTEFSCTAWERSCERESAQLSWNVTYSCGRIVSASVQVCRWFTLLILSEKLKQGLNVISDCQDDWETLCSHKECDEQRPISSVRPFQRRSADGPRVCFNLLDFNSFTTAIFFNSLKWDFESHSLFAYCDELEEKCNMLSMMVQSFIVPDALGNIG
jgi:hypothetical protein